MKKLILILSIFLGSICQVFSAEPTEQEIKEIEMAKFLVNEVIPAFGGLKNALLTNKPKLKLQFNSQGAKLVDCSFEFRLQQLKHINFKLLDVPLYEFNANASIGDKRWLNFKIDCGELSTEADTNHFKTSFFITNEEGEKSFYPLVIDALEQEQLDLKFYGANIELKITTKEKELLLSSEGELIDFSNDYESYRSEGTLYIIPQDGGKNSDTLERITSVSQVELNGELIMALPISVNGEKVQTQFKIPVSGVIHTTDNGLTIPLVNIEFGQ